MRRRVGWPHGAPNKRVRAVRAGLHTCRHRLVVVVVVVVVVMAVVVVIIHNETVFEGSPTLVGGVGAD